MIGDPNRLRTIEAHELARFARIIRCGESGWEFRANDGTAYRISKDEADRLEAEAIGILQRYLTGLRRATQRMVLIGAIACAAFMAIVTMLPEPMQLQALIWFSPVTFVVLMSQSFGGIVYERALRNWSAATARRLEAAGGSTIATTMASRDRRSFLLKSAGQLCMLAFLVRMVPPIVEGGGAWRNLLPEIVAGGRVTATIDIGLLVLGYACFVAGRRIEAAQPLR